MSKYTNSEFNSENIGKSTLLNYLSRKFDRKINKVTLDDLIFRQQVPEDSTLFLRTHETSLIIKLNIFN